MANPIERYASLLNAAAPGGITRFVLFQEMEGQDYDTESDYGDSVDLNEPYAVIRDITWSPLSTPSVGFDSLERIHGAWSFNIVAYSRSADIFLTLVPIHGALRSGITANERIIDVNISQERDQEKRIFAFTINVSILGYNID